MAPFGAQTCSPELSRTFWEEDRKETFSQCVWRPGKAFEIKLG
jgi:hypothetical protein